MISHAPSGTSPSIISPRLQAVTDRTGYDYLISVPDSYADSSTRHWPLVLFLHGSGQRGTDVWQVTQQGIPKLLLESADLTEAERLVAAELNQRFIVVAPQCPVYEVWDDSDLLAILDDIGDGLRVDKTRVYLTGLSMGGFGAWSLGIRNPERFAALIPICGGGRVADIENAPAKRRVALQNLAVWAFHGAKDGIVPVAESERMVDALKSAGGHDVRLTIFPDAEHDAWSAAYSNPEIYTWLLRHERQAVP